MFWGEPICELEVWCHAVEGEGAADGAVSGHRGGVAIDMCRWSFMHSVLVRSWPFVLAVVLVVGRMDWYCIQPTSHAKLICNNFYLRKCESGGSIFVFKGP